MKRINKKVVKIILGSLLGIGLFSAPAFSATMTVTSSSDNGAGTLRQAVSDATSGDTILFSLSYPATITLSSTITLNKNLTIKGPGSSHLSISGNNAVRVFDMTAGTVTLSGLTIENGRVTTAGADGAAFRISGSSVLTIDRCIITNNQLTGTTSTGGAIWTEAGTTLNIDRSQLSSNSVPTTSGCYGGAIYSEGNVTLTSCTLSGNTGYLGGAIADYASSGKTLSMTNCTVSGNTSYYDGVVAHQMTGAMNLTNCTITNNVSSQYEAGLFVDAGTVTLRNTIIADNLPSDGMGDRDLFVDTAGLYPSGSPNTATFTSNGYNLIGSTGSQTYTWTTGDVVGTESSLQSANLGSLADNGGYVNSHDPNSGSQVIDPASSNSAPLVDGRGYLRSSTAEKGSCEDGGTLPVATSASAVSETTMNANWNSVTGAAGYLLDVATDSAFTQMVSGYRGLDTGNVTTYPVSGLTESATYYYRLRAYNGNHHTYYSNTITQATSAAATSTFTPTVTLTPTLTLTASVTSTLTGTPTLTPTPTFSPTASMTLTMTASRTGTPTLSPTATLSPTSTATPLVSATLSGTTTLTYTMTPTATPSGTETPTPSHTPTGSPTSTQTPFVTPTPSGSITPTATMTATASPTTTIAAAGGAIAAYPVPARNRMYFPLILENPGEVEITIYNTAGERIALLRRILPAGPGTMAWDCAAVARGIYFVNIETPDEKKKLKVAVVK